MKKKSDIAIIRSKLSLEKVHYYIQTTTKNYEMLLLFLPNL